MAPDGKTVVSGSGDRMVRIWNISSNQRPQMLKGHSSDIGKVEISFDGKTIISRSYDEIKIWDLATGKLKVTLPNFSPMEIEIGDSILIEDNSPYFQTLTISPDGKTALVNLGSKFLAWDLATNQQKVLQTSWFNHFYSPRISLDGQTAVTTSYRTHLVSLHSPV
ncbi:WD40 repeat domain-containing protein [Lyngbya aestuarii]|uniref:WD40 repeat domain-containing protein n=1 Tax=Lyngbya aestuarii TaxID=118322 RepID=UPI00403DE014